MGSRFPYTNVCCCFGDISFVLFIGKIGELLHLKFGDLEKFLFIPEEYEHIRFFTCRW